MSVKLNVFTGKFDFTDLPSGSYFKKNGNVLELWWNGALVQSWEYTAVAPTIVEGNPYGLLLTLTYPATP